MTALAVILGAVAGWALLRPAFLALLGLDTIEGADEPRDPAYGLKRKQTKS